MDHLTNEQLAVLREKLERMRDEFLELAKKHQAAALANRARDMGDRQDAASIEANRGREIHLAHHEHRQLREVEAALERIHQGTYGICAETEEPIPFARLLLQPTTRFTVEAQEALEQAKEDEDVEEDPY